MQGQDHLGMLPIEEKYARIPSKQGYTSPASLGSLAKNYLEFAGTSLNKLIVHAEKVSFCSLTL